MLNILTGVPPLFKQEQNGTQNDQFARLVGIIENAMHKTTCVSSLN